jgi:thiamine biosynthesis lipoprotein
MDPAMETAWRLAARIEGDEIRFSFAADDSACAPEEGRLPQLAFTAMGCGMLAVLDCNPALAQPALARIPAMFERWEAALSRFRGESELSRLNRSSGNTMTASPVLFGLLKMSIRMAEASNGLVVPTVGNDLIAAGYDRSFDELPADRPGMPWIERNFQASEPWRQICLQRRGRKVWVPQSIRLDLGGIAKGWAADRAVRQLARLGPALMDAGGDIAVSGPRGDGSPWAIGVEDPMGHAQQIAMLAIERGGMATSGLDYRHWKVAGEWQHHLIDPRTGRPAQTDLLSVTIIGPSAAKAEVAAKVVLLLGSEKGLQWVDKQRELAALLVTDEGDVVLSYRMPGYIWS